MRHVERRLLPSTSAETTATRLDIDNLFMSRIMRDRSRISQWLILNDLGTDNDRGASRRRPTYGPFLYLIRVGGTALRVSSPAARWARRQGRLPNLNTASLLSSSTTLRPPLPRRGSEALSQRVFVTVTVSYTCHCTYVVITLGFEEVANGPD